MGVSSRGLQLGHAPICEPHLHERRPQLKKCSLNPNYASTHLRRKLSCRAGPGNAGGSGITPFKLPCSRNLDDGLTSAFSPGIGADCDDDDDQDACTARLARNAATYNVCKQTGEEGQGQGMDGNREQRHCASPSVTPPNIVGSESSSNKIKRFSFTQYAFLNAHQPKTLLPLEQERLRLLMEFKSTSNAVKGQLVIRAARSEQLKGLEDLLCDSYSEIMWGPFTYRPALSWILSAYLKERQAYLPDAVTLVGLYKPTIAGMNDDDGGAGDATSSSDKWWLAGAVEVSFNASGKPKDMQTPLPPEDAPFLSNMAVLKKFRRRGIGRELLKAAEQVAAQMGGKEMYLHCRMIDEAPYNMYKNYGYAVVETDSILSLLLCQRRRHLMCKTLANSSSAPAEEIRIPPD